MPYAFALAGFAIFFALGAIGTASSFLFASLRGLRTYAWRAWLWGCIGFFLTNALLLAIIAYSLRHVGIASNTDRQTEILGMILGGAVAFGPLVASASGISLGVFVGCYFGSRKLAISATVEQFERSRGASSVSQGGNR
jgi:hypothetical protein